MNSNSASPIISNGTSIHLTLPISCQICLGKVKDPAICSNYHVFCSTCLDMWLNHREFCPACRVPINENNPYKKILGSFDDTMEEIVSDPMVKSQMRRTRLKMLFDEFQVETDYLEDSMKNITAENTRLKEENEELRTQLDERDMHELKRAQNYASVSNNIKPNESSSSSVSDITTILKLSNKLQEMIRANEKMAQVNTALRRDVKTIGIEKEQYLQDIRRLKEENKFPQSPQKYNKYAMVALQTKVDNYEREIQQWKKAVKRADDYIEELASQIETLKNGRVHSPSLTTLVSASGSQRNSPSFTSVRDNDLATESRRFGDSVASLSRTRDFSENQTFGSRTASETLKMLSTKSSGHIETTSINSINKDRRSTSPINERPASLIEQIFKPDSNSENIDDIERFPACAKLLELTKARHVLPQTHSRQLFQEHSNSSIQEISHKTSVVRSPSSVGDGLTRSKHTQDETETLKRNLENQDITLVLPSSEQSASWLQQVGRKRTTNSPRSGRSTPHDFTYSSVKFDNSRYIHRTEMNNSTSTNGETTTSKILPSKKIKVENPDS